MDDNDRKYLNSQPDGKTVITTERLQIRELVRKNAAAVLEILSHCPGNGTVFDDTLHLDRIMSGDPELLLGALIARDLTDQYRFFGYGLWGVFTDSGLIGLAMLKNGSGSGIAEIGYVIRDDHRREGLMTEAMLAVLEFAHDQGFSSVEVRTRHTNTASVSFFSNLKAQYILKYKRKQHSGPVLSGDKCCVAHTESGQTADVDSLSFTL